MIGLPIGLPLSASGCTLAGRMVTSFPSPPLEIPPPPIWWIPRWAYEILAARGVDPMSLAAK